MSKFIPFRCSICQRFVQNETNCSAQPVNAGRCCLECDCTVVTPARLRLLGLSDQAAKAHAEFALDIYRRNKADPDWFLKEVDKAKEALSHESK